MSFAYVYLHGKNGKKSYKCVKTNQIKKFNTVSFELESKSTRSQVPYALIQADNSRDTCQVLAVADSAKDIEQISNSQRFPVPKLSNSVIDSARWNVSTSDLSDSESEKTERKKIKSLKRKVSDKVDQEIINKYRKMNKAYSSEQKEREEEEEEEKEEEEDGEEDLSENDCSFEEASLNKPKFSSTPTLKNKLKSSQLDPVFIDVNKVNNRSYNVDIGSKTDVDLEDQLRDAQDQIKYWKAKYKSLVSSQNYPLTEKTGQKLVSLVNQLAANYEYETKPEDNGSGQKRGSTSSASSKEKNHESISNNSGEKKSTSDSLSQSIYDSKVNSVFEKNFKDPAECAKSIVRSLWTTEELQQRVVRPIAGNDKNVLTPTKVNKGKTLFSVWLKDNGYIRAAKTKEMSRWNNHMSRAIESALKLKKKHLAVKTKSTENKENKNNAAKSQDDEKKKNIDEEETNSDN